MSSLSLSSSAADDEDAIKIVCQFRRLNTIKGKTRSKLPNSNDENSISVGGKVYVFDKVFKPEGQEVIYQNGTTSGKGAKTMNGVELTAEEWKSRYEKDVGRLQDKLTKAKEELSRWRKGETVSEDEQVSFKESERSENVESESDESPLAKPKRVVKTATISSEDEAPSPTPTLFVPRSTAGVDDEDDEEEQSQSLLASQLSEDMFGDYFDPPAANEEQDIHNESNSLQEEAILEPIPDNSIPDEIEEEEILMDVNVSLEESDPLLNDLKVDLDEPPSPTVTVFVPRSAAAESDDEDDDENDDDDVPLARRKKEAKQSKPKNSKKADDSPESSKEDDVTIPLTRMKKEQAKNSKSRKSDDSAHSSKEDDDFDVPLARTRRNKEQAKKAKSKAKMSNDSAESSKEDDEIPLTRMKKEPAKQSKSNKSDDSSASVDEPVESSKEDDEIPLTRMKKEHVKQSSKTRKSDDSSASVESSKEDNNIPLEMKSKQNKSKKSADFSALIPSSKSEKVETKNAKLFLSYIKNESNSTKVIGEATEEPSSEIEEEEAEASSKNSKKSKVKEIVDNEKPSTSKKVAAELVKTQRRRNKLAKSDAEARRGVLDSSSDASDEEEEVEVDSGVKIKKTKTKRRQSLQKSRLITPEEIAEDPKLNDTAATVKLVRLASEIEDQLKKKKFITIKDNEGDSSDGSDITSLNRAINNLKKYNAVVTKRSRRPRKSVKKASKKTAEKDLKEIESDGSDAAGHKISDLGDLNSDEEQPQIAIKDFREILESDQNLSELEDLSPDSQIKNEKQASKDKIEKEKPGSSNNKNKYKPLKLDGSSGSDSDRNDRNAVLRKGSGSDDSLFEKVKTSKSKKKKNVDSSSDDSDEVKVVKRGKKKRLAVRSDSDESNKSDDSDSDSVKITDESNSGSDSDFQSPKKKKKASKSKKRSHQTSSDEEDNKKKKKRKRIKQAKDSEEDGSDSDVQEVEAVPGSQKRKEIRKIIKKKDLKKSTREAEKEEEERKKRVAEKQKLFNGIFETSELIEGGETKQLILEFDAETKKPIIEVDSTIVEQLKPHQLTGIKFMYTTCFESVEQIKKGKSGGCILAHCMGLGKTLQTVAFAHTVMDHKELTGVKRVLVVCPLNTVNNWYKEFQKWLTDIETERKPRLHCLWDAKNILQRVEALKIWERKGGVGIIHYDLFRVLVSAVTSKAKKNKVKQSYRDVIQRMLMDPGPDMVVCDEGHLLKNHKSKLSEALSQVKTLRRIVLTGTPLQNNLVEYHTMVQFVKPNLLGTLKEFTNRFVNPIKNGQCKDSGERDVKTMKRRAHVLHSKLDGCVQRLDYSVLTPYLPPKYEYCIIIKLSEKQKALYRDYLQNQVSPDLTDRSRQLLKHYATLVKILAHPIVLTMKKDIDKSGGETDEEGSLKDFLDDGSEDDVTTPNDSDNSDIEWLDAEKLKAQRKNLRSCKADPDAPPEEEVSNQSLPKTGFGKEWWGSHFAKKEDMYDMELSGKMVVLQEILKTCETIGDKVLVFSQYLTTLDIVEEFLSEWDEAAVKANGGKEKTFPPTLGESEGRWRPNIEYFRIDGSTKTGDRQKNCDIFNKKTTSSRAKLFLISTRAGGLGINLFGANRVVLFDASWNPSNDMQSIFRVYRFGQLKPCYIYRFVAQATMEEKIYNRQVVKLSLSSRVVDEHQVERHFKFNDINEMYQFDPDEKVERPTPPLPKDRLLADLLISHKIWIDSYFEHDTLLINKEDETLTEEERKVAWDEYQNESERRTLPPQQNVSDVATLMKIKLKLAERFPTANDMQIQQSALVVLARIHELRKLLQRLNFEGPRMTPEARAELEQRIKRLQDWISQSLGQNEGVQQLENIPPPQPRPMPTLARNTNLRGTVSQNLEIQRQILAQMATARAQMSANVAGQPFLNGMLNGSASNGFNAYTGMRHPNPSVYSNSATARLQQMTNGGPSRAANLDEGTSDDPMILD